MLKKMIFIFTLIFSQVSLAESLIARVEKGYRLPLDLIIQDYILLEKTPEAPYLQNYILKTNYKISAIDAEEISESIVTISGCLEIDPWILTALIQKESSFNKLATSPTGAAGLTQFTSIGIKEVNDQLGFRGTTGAPETVTEYLTTQIKSCVSQEWKHFWTRIDINETSPDFYPVLKEELKKDILGAVLYGAVLLKVYLGVVTTRNNFAVSPMSPSDTYYQALQMYNGEEGEAKIKYAKNVFQNVQTLYPDQISFPY